MVNEQVLRGHWSELKSRLLVRWSQLKDEDLAGFKGDAGELVALVQHATGEAREAVEGFLEDIAGEAVQAAKLARNSAGKVAGKAADKFHDQQERIAAGVRHTATETNRIVRERPAEAVAVAFGAGLLAGLAIGLIIRSRD